MNGVTFEPYQFGAGFRLSEWILFPWIDVPDPNHVTSLNSGDTNQNNKIDPEMNGLLLDFFLTTHMFVKSV